MKGTYQAEFIKVFRRVLSARTNSSLIEELAELQEITSRATFCDAAYLVTERPVQDQFYTVRVSIAVSALNQAAKWLVKHRSIGDPKILPEGYNGKEFARHWEHPRLRAVLAGMHNINKTFS